MSKKQEEVIEEVRKSVLEAAQKLAAVSPECERVAWLLEDALTFLDGRNEADDFDVSEILEKEFGENLIRLGVSNS